MSVRSVTQPCTAAPDFSEAFRRDGQHPVSSLTNYCDFCLMMGIRTAVQERASRKLAGFVSISRLFVINRTTDASAFQGTYGSSASQSFRHPDITLVFKTTFEVFTRVGPDNSLERLTERSVGLVTDRPSDVYELFVTLL